MPRSQRSTAGPEEVEIVNERGMHARAAAKLATLVTTFEARITITCEGESVSADSIMGLLTLGAARGAVVSVRATGPNAQSALDSVKALIGRGFDE